MLIYIFSTYCFIGDSSQLILLPGKSAPGGWNIVDIPFMKRNIMIRTHFYCGHNIIDPKVPLAEYYLGSSRDYIKIINALFRFSNNNLYLLK